MNIAMIGAGLQARRHSEAIKENPDVTLVAVASARLERAKRLADDMECEAVPDWKDLLARDDIDAAIICTPPNLHPEMALAAARNGKHILCEKPLARTLGEAREMVSEARSNGVTLMAGFNHRYHPGIRQAKKWLDSREIGDVMHLRCRYGIGGRPGYEKEWRCDPEVVGGGHLTEHGIHAIDLFRWFAGDFSSVFAFAETRFWDIEPLEDNAFVLLKTDEGVVASLHSSLTQWKNLFSMEVFGSEGYILIEGFGGSYGVERATLGQRDYTAPEHVIEYRGPDISWSGQLREFLSAVNEGREPEGNGEDGLKAMELVAAAYRSSDEKLMISL